MKFKHYAKQWYQAAQKRLDKVAVMKQTKRLNSWDTVSMSFAIEG